MKIPQLLLIAGALSCAVLLSAQGRLPAGCPSGYELVSTTTLNETMGGFKNLTWQSYLARDPRPQGKLKNRAHAWLHGSFTVATGSGLRISLHELGAQHRELTVLVRVTPKTPGKSAQLFLVEKNGFPVNIPQSPIAPPPSDSPLVGFYWIGASGPKQTGTITKFENSYALVLEDGEWELDVFYFDHLPGRGAQQLEDGGPPPTYPSTLN